MSWSTGYSKYLEDYNTSKKVIKYIKSLNISIGDKAIHDNELKIIKELWITPHANDFTIRVEFEGRWEDSLYDIKDIVYGDKVKLFYEKAKD